MKLERVSNKLKKAAIVLATVAGVIMAEQIQKKGEQINQLEKDLGKNQVQTLVKSEKAGYYAEQLRALNEKAGILNYNLNLFVLKFSQYKEVKGAEKEKLSKELKNLNYKILVTFSDADMILLKLKKDFIFANFRSLNDYITSINQLKFQYADFLETHRADLPVDFPFADLKASVDVTKI